MIDPNSRVRNGGRMDVKGSMEEFEGRSRGILTTEIVELSQQQVAPCVKWVERFENSSSVLGRQPGFFSLYCRSYTGDHLSPMP